MLEYKKDGWKAAIALAPTLLLMALFTFYPIIRTVITAFMEGYTFGATVTLPDGSVMSEWLARFGQTEYLYDMNHNIVGTKNFGFGFGIFKKVLTDTRFLLALKNTSIMVFISVPLTIIIALLISVGLNSIKKLQGFYQTIFFLPYVTNTIALGLVFSFMFSTDHGLINNILTALGGDAVAWIYAGNVNMAPPSYGSALFVLMTYTVWNGLAFKILVFLSGMQSIDKQYYQAAQVDGTPRWRTFTKITVPLLAPMIIYIMITSFIGAFKAYTSVISLFSGRFGPLNEPDMLITVVGYAYESMAIITETDALGKASAASLILFAIIMIITFVQMQYNKRRVHY